MVEENLSRQSDFSARDIWVFDLDNTLYPASCDLFALIDVRMTDFIMRLLDLNHAAARKLQKDYFRQYGTTLKGLMERHHVDPHDFLHHVHDIELDRIAADPHLNSQLGALPGRKVIYTNGSTRHAANVIEKLGIEVHFDGIFDIAAGDFVPKPHQQSFDRFLNDHAIDATRAVMFEDMARNLAPAARRGMATVWIDNGSELGGHEHEGDVIDLRTPDLKSSLEHILKLF